jgi:hypothetical protein
MVDRIVPLLSYLIKTRPQTSSIAPIAEGIGGVVVAIVVVVIRVFNR